MEIIVSKPGNRETREISQRDEGQPGAFEGFSKLSLEQRLTRLHEIGALSSEDLAHLLIREKMPIELAENFIENAIGYFQLPLGVAAHFEIDGRAIPIPMAVEETSIIAAASKTAKWIREYGFIRTENLGKCIVGQIQISKVKNAEGLQRAHLKFQESWIQMANVEVAQGLVSRGGGVKAITLRWLEREDGEKMAVFHVLADPCDAMGANIINQVCEFLRNPIEEQSGESVTMCILSNLVDTRLTRATIRMHGLERDLAEKIVEASIFAQLDPYRAATHNKGVMNGIDPILMATGNDWRAVEAGVHAFAARDGQYRGITRWWMEEDELVGEFLAPIILGTVGGVTKLHPTAQVCLKMMGVKSAEELSRICAAVGLAQNLGALRALTTVGIIEGHMKLHIKNLMIGAGAREREMPFVQKRLEEILRFRKRISLSNAVDAVRELRSRKGSSIPSEI